MNKLIICLGPSCSGKSTWSKNYVKEYPEYYRFSIDEFKEMNSSGEGKQVINAEFLYCVSDVITAMLKYSNVIVDGYPLNIRSLMVISKASIETEIRLFDVKFSEAVKRNQIRKKLGGHYLSIIELKKFHKTYEEFIISEKFKKMTAFPRFKVIIEDFQEINIAFLGPAYF